MKVKLFIAKLLGIQVVPKSFYIVSPDRLETVEVEVEQSAYAVRNKLYEAVTLELASKGLFDVYKQEFVDGTGRHKVRIRVRIKAIKPFDR